MGGIAKELVEDGKTTLKFAIEGLQWIEVDLKSLSADDETKVTLMLNDLGRQIEMLQALQGKIRRHVKLPDATSTPTPAPYSVLESSPT